MSNSKYIKEIEPEEQSSFIVPSEDNSAFL